VSAYLAPCPTNTEGLRQWWGFSLCGIFLTEALFLKGKLMHVNNKIEAVKYLSLFMVGGIVLLLLFPLYMFKDFYVIINSFCDWYEKPI
jgi:hypothetical protein